MKKTIISTFMALTFISIAQANEKTGDLKSSATMEAMCSISASPIGFGAVSAPLLAQTANSEMTVKCNNASAYTIDLAYGGIYGQGTGVTSKTLSFNSNNSTSKINNYNLYDDAGNYFGVLQCGYGGSVANQFKFATIGGAKLYGDYTVGWHSNGSTNICTTNGTVAGTYPTEWKGVYNAPGNQKIGNPSYDYGMMNGLSRGDKLAYSIAVPGDITKVWNAGNNSYKSTGTGDSQTIPLNAKIVPDKSGSKYPAPDMYVDIVTAVINY